jgi:hypothetical protein
VAGDCHSYRDPESNPAYTPTKRRHECFAGTAGYGRFLMQCYNWKRPHQFNGGLPPAVAEEKLGAVSGLVGHYRYSTGVKPAPAEWPNREPRSDRRSPGAS